MSTMTNINEAMRDIGLYAGADGIVRKMSLDTSDATATAADIAQGKTAYTAEGLVAGILLQPCGSDTPTSVTCYNNVAVDLSPYSLLYFICYRYDTSDNYFVVILPQTRKAFSFKASIYRDSLNLEIPRNLNSEFSWSTQGLKQNRTYTYSATLNTLTISSDNSEFIKDSITAYQ